MSKMMIMTVLIIIIMMMMMMMLMMTIPISCPNSSFENLLRKFFQNSILLSQFHATEESITSVGLTNVTTLGSLTAHSSCLEDGLSREVEVTKTTTRLSNQTMQTIGKYNSNDDNNK